MRNGTIDFMKFMSSIFIIFLHALMFMEPHKGIPFTALAVDFFFIVSGYLVYTSTMKNKHKVKIEDLGGQTKQFFLNKIKKIYVEYAVSLAIGYFVLNIIFFQSFSRCIKSFLVCIGELTFWNLFGFPTDGWSNVGWYIITLFICSVIIFLILIKIEYNFYILLFPILIFLSYGFLIRNFNTFIVALETIPYGVIPLGIVRGFAGMLLGCESAFLSRKIKNINCKNRLIKFLLTLVEVFGYFSYMRLAFMHKDLGANNIFIIVFLTISIGISFSENSYLAKMFNHDICRWLGLFSLNIYLNHNYLAYAIKENKVIFNDVNVIPAYILGVLFLSLCNKIISDYIKRLIN